MRPAVACYPTERKVSPWSFTLSARVHFIFSVQTGNDAMQIADVECKLSPMTPASDELCRGGRKFLRQGNPATTAIWRSDRGRDWQLVAAPPLSPVACSVANSAVSHPPQGRRADTVRFGRCLRIWQQQRLNYGGRAKSVQERRDEVCTRGADFAVMPIRAKGSGADQRKRAAKDGASAARNASTCVV